jgi:hypothetical protein
MQLRGNGSNSVASLGLCGKSRQPLLDGKYRGAVHGSGKSKFVKFKPFLERRSAAASRSTSTGACRAAGSMARTGYGRDRQRRPRDRAHAAGGRRLDHAGLQYRGDEPASCENRQNCRTRIPRRSSRRSGWMAFVRASGCSNQYHHRSPAAEIPRAQSGRKPLAIHARQLALKPRLRLLR